MSGPKHFDGQTKWDVWAPEHGILGWAQPGWALPSDATRYIGKDDPYWNTVLDDARRTYGDPDIHYNTDDIGRPRELVFGDQTALPKDATVVYHDASTGANWVQNDDGTASLVGPGGTSDPPVKPSGYRKAGSGYAPIDERGRQIGPQVRAIPAGDNVVHPGPSTGDADALATDWQQSGKAADAVAKLQDELKKQYSAISDAEEGLSQVLIGAHAATAGGRQRLNQIQSTIIDAVNNPSMSIDTPAGERSFLMFLHSQVGAINDLVSSGSLTADDQAKAASALSKLYAVDDSGSHTDHTDHTDPEPAPDEAMPDPLRSDELGAAPRSDELGAAPMDTGIGADPPPSLTSEPLTSEPLASEPLASEPLTSELGSAIPLDGAGGLADAIAQLAGLASQARDRGVDHSPSTVEKVDDTAVRPKDTADKGDKPAPVSKQPAAPVSMQPAPPSPTDTVRLPDGSSADARTAAAAKAVEAYLNGDTIDAAYRENDLTLPPPGTPVTEPVDPSQLTCGDVGIFKDHYVVALSSVKALANGQVVALGSVASSPDFLGWIDPTSTPPRPRSDRNQAATAIPAG